MRAQNLLGNPRIVKDTMEFVEKMGRLKFTKKQRNVLGGLEAQISKEKRGSASVRNQSIQYQIMYHSL